MDTHEIDPLHKLNRISEKDIIPDGDFVSVVPTWAAPEGTEVSYLNGSTFRRYKIIDGTWRDIGNTTSLGTIATQSANNVAITGGSITGITDLAVADGGTGASNAADARSNLGAPADADVVHDTGNETVAGIKTFSSDPLIPDEAYGSGWNGSLEPPTKNAVYDKIEALTGTGTKIASTYTDTVYASGTSDAPATAIATATIPGGTLGTGNAVRLKGIITDWNNIAGNNPTLRLKYGGNLICSTTFTGAATSTQKGWFEVLLLATGATGTQEASIVWHTEEEQLAAGTPDDLYFYVGSGTCSTDSTTDQTLEVTFDWNNWNDGASITVAHVIVDKIT